MYNKVNILIIPVHPTVLRNIIRDIDGVDK